MSYETSQSELETLFAQVGPIKDVFLPADRDTGRPRGFAFVEFEGDVAAAEAIEKFDGYELDGRNLRVNEADQRPRREPFGGGGGFRGGHGGGAPPPKKARPKGSRRNLRGKKRSL